MHVSTSAKRLSHAAKDAPDAKAKADDRHAARPGGDCGTGAGGFKPGNTCGGHSGPRKQSDPAVLAAHHRIRRSRASHKDSHIESVAYIAEGKDRDGKTAKLNPQAKADADTLADYEPAKGHVAIGLLPGRPSEAEALAVGRIVRQQKRGEAVNDHELDAMVDRDVSHIRTRNGWSDSDIDGHRFLVHNRLTGINDIHSERNLHSYNRYTRSDLHGTTANHYVPLRQFNSQGVEVELDQDRFRHATSPKTQLGRPNDYHQDASELAAERAAVKGVRRARFATSEPKYS